jgi:hypothetical protein
MRAQRLHLDLLAPPGARRRRGLLLLLCGVLLCSAVLAWAQRDAWLLSQAQAQLDQQLHQARRAAAARTSSSASAVAGGPSADDKLARAARQLGKDLATPWGALLGALEKGQTPDVALLLIEPSANDRSVRLSLEARNARAMLSYLEQLEADPRLGGVMLLSHQAGVEGTPAAVRFQLRAFWGAQP